MRPFTLLFSIALGVFLLPESLFAQHSLITIERNGQSFFFETINPVIIQSQAGDTIKFPGGPFIIPGGEWIIDKKLHVFGVGWRADSSIATGKTELIGNITLNNGADDSQLSGVSIAGHLYFGQTTALGNISGVVISRCMIQNKITLRSGTHNNLFYNNVVIGQPNSSNGCIVFNSAQANLFENNIFNRTLIGPIGAGTELRNNIFLVTTGQTISSSSYFSNVTFTRNIFLSSNNSPGTAIENSSFVENLVVGNWTSLGTNSSVGNIYNQAQSSIFVNQSGDNFNLGHNYHLKASSPGYAGGGQNQMGIYGGTYAWKENAHPVFPRIKAAQVGSSTDANGNLQVMFTVEAQNQ